MTFPRDALCATLPMEQSERLFFGRDWTARHEGAALCRQCPVRSECLAEATRLEGALSAAYRCGTWGGLTAEQRAKACR